MPGPRKLWTGPHGSALRDRAIERASHEASSLWLVPSPVARDQVIRALACRSKGTDPPGGGCGAAPGRAPAGARADPPARLSRTGKIAVLSGAIERARRSDHLDVLARAVDGPGYRRRLLDRF